MSDCIIQIKIGDTIITLDPNSNISSTDTSSLITNLDPAKLRTLFTNLKGKVSLESTIKMDVDPALANKGEILYNQLLNEEKDSILTPMAALYKEKNEDNKLALKAYISTLDSTLVNDTGDFLANPHRAYQLSPYSVKEIRGIFFNRSSATARIFDQLTSIPGMETLRISVAVRDEFQGSPLTKARGAYLTPDNIIQIIVPPTYYIRGADSSKLTVKSFDKDGLDDMRNNLLHELSHAVYSELYNSNDEFKDSIDLIFEAFKEAMKKSVKPGDSAEGRKYDGKVHEFIADMFVSRSLKSKLSSISPLGGIATPEKGNLYDTFIATLGSKLTAQPSLLRQAVSIMDTSIRVNNIQDTFDEVQKEAVEQDRQHIFFSDGITQQEINERISPRDYGDNYGGVNAQAFWIQSRFNHRHDVVDNKFTIRDAYYAKQIFTPTAQQIDRLREEDLVSIPWLRYVKGMGENAGKWQEQGVLVNDKGKEILKDGKIQVVDIQRDTKGEIIQGKKKSEVIAERTKLVPVVYVNRKKGKVVVAKTGLSESQEFNSVSLPYTLIRGIRRINKDYFNHNEDFETQLKEVKKQKKIKNKSLKDADDIESAMIAYDKRIEALEEAQRMAAQIKQDISNHFFDRAFSATKDGIKYTNVSRKNYVDSGYDTKDIEFREFNDSDPLYIIAEDRDGKWRARPNPEIFRTLWQGDSATAWAAESAEIGESVSKDDMIRLSVNKIVEDDKGNKISFKQNSWFSVYEKLPNGILVATAGGKGMIIPFAQIDSYAKNLQTTEFTNLVTKVEQAQDLFEQQMYVEDPTTKKRRMNKEWSKANVDYDTLKFDEKYHVRAKEAVETARLRFDKNKQKALAKIVPGKTFVKVLRTFMNTESTKKKGDIQEYTTNDLIVAKSPNGVIVMNNKGKSLRFEWIGFDDKIDDKTAYGKELQFIMHDISAVHTVWQEYADERASYDKLKKTSAWENVGTAKSPKWEKAFDTTETPRNYRDVYDFYDDADGVKIANLMQGDVVGLEFTKKGEDTPQTYYRKVVDVYEDGSVTVADYYTPNELDKAKGWNFKEGAFPRVIEGNQIKKVGYKRFTNQTATDGKRQVRESLYARRDVLLAKAESDINWNDFNFAARTQAENWNKNIKNPDGWHRRYVPFTKAILDYGAKDENGKPLVQGSDADKIFLNKKLAVVDPKNAVYVQALFNGTTLVNTFRGIAANTSFFKGEDITYKNKGYTNLNKDILAEIMPGDWAVTSYVNKKNQKKSWAQLIDRIENNKIYVINEDRTTTAVNMNKFVGIKTSVRNDKFSNFKRTNKLLDIIKKAKEAKAPKKEMASLVAEYKSPADSQRAIFEIGDRFEGLNPQVKVNYLTSDEVDAVGDATDFNYTDARAFILNGQVNINMGKASISDVIHEYGHLFLHALKYESPEMYNNIINTTLQHPIYDAVATQYAHLEGDDLNEEVFVTVLGEYLKGSLKDKEQEWQDGKKDVILGFAEYTKRKLNQTMGRPIDNLYDLAPEEVLSLSFEDVINLIGDEIMQSRISNLYDVPVKFTRDINKLKTDLLNSNQLTQDCYE